MVATYRVYVRSVLVCMRCISTSPEGGWPGLMVHRVTGVESELFQSRDRTDSNKRGLRSIGMRCEPHANASRAARDSLCLDRRQKSNTKKKPNVKHRLVPLRFREPDRSFRRDIGLPMSARTSQ